MTKYNIDLHLHSPYAAACSSGISIPSLTNGAKQKGLNILSTGDILHPIWNKHVKENLIQKNECFLYKEQNSQIYFILGVEIETKERIHHLLYFKDFEQIETFKKQILKYSTDMEKYGGGRPRISLNSQQIFEIAKDNEIVIGPAHAFTPYFGIYAHYDSLKQAYGDNWKQIRFLELGLSADTYLANTIPDLKEIQFFSFSDAHSPVPYRLGREFVCTELEQPNFYSLQKLLEKKGKNKILFNVGYNPQEGKYHTTACKDCGQIYEIEEAIRYKYRCIKCKGIIKKGVKDRIKEIAILQGNKELKQTTERPEYKYLIPLSQIIQIALNKKNILDKQITEIYNTFIQNNSEIDTMLNIDEKTLKQINPEITKYIMAFRKNLVVFRPGGGGNYGVPYICFTEKEKQEKQKQIEQETKLTEKTIQKTLF
ncbi:MAG TPA: endonuclease Q family protein [Candidatus Diapherotrites archaeon]|nr:endonuclease Q family protein [Candidatus Diapherotrites archaeon]